MAVTPGFSLNVIGTKRTWYDHVSIARPSTAQPQLLVNTQPFRVRGSGTPFTTLKPEPILPLKILGPLDPSNHDATQAESDIYGVRSPWALWSTGV